MKIAIPIKQAAVLDEEDPELRDDGRDVDVDYLDWDLNEWDEFSVEAAVQLKEAAGGEVIVLTVAGEEADEALRAFIAKGADRAVRIESEDLDDLDAIATARLLAAAIKSEEPDLVLCGVQSSDHAGGSTGAALAALLDLPRAAVVTKIVVDGGALTVDRELEGGLIEEVQLPLPALLTVQTGINEPRYASLRAIKQAAEGRLDVVEIGDLGFDEEAVAAGTASKVRRIRTPEVDGAEMLEGSPDELADRILALISERAG